MQASIGDFVSPIGLYSNVDPDPALRQAADDCELKISKYLTSMYQSPKLYAQFKKLKATDPVDEKFLKDILNQFENRGTTQRRETEASEGNY